MTRLTRREFLKRAGKGAAGLALLASGCASTLKETRQDVERIKWDCNPILPIPAKGCYTGTNRQVPPVHCIESFEESYGITPTFIAPGIGHWYVENDRFPKYDCEAAINNGSIPVIRYVISPFEGFKPIIKGKYDGDIRKFAHQAAEFEHPIILLPFQMPNQPASARQDYHWAEYPAGQYKEA